MVFGPKKLEPLCQKYNRVKEIRTREDGYKFFNDLNQLTNAIDLFAASEEYLRSFLNKLKTQSQKKNALTVYKERFLNESPLFFSSSFDFLKELESSPTIFYSNYHV
jgi:hypothetical protein